MTRHLTYVLLAAAMVAATASRVEAADPPQTLRMPRQQLAPSMAAELTKAQAVLADSNAAKRLIAGTIGTKEQMNIDDPNFYCAIHLVQWGQVSTDGTTFHPVVTDQHWYLYRGGSRNFISVGFADRTRLLSSDRFYVLWVDLSFSADDKTERSYKIDVKSKPATNVAHLMDLITAFTTLAKDATVPSFFGYGQVDMRGAQAADVSITPQASKGDKDAPIGDAKVYNFEPLQWWDVGIGVPIHRASEVSLDADTQTISPKDIDKNTLLVQLSVYYEPIDLQSTGLRTAPHLVVGLDATEKFDPRKRFFVGGGWGPALANFYFGGELVKLDQPSPSGKTREWQLAFGLSFSGLGTLKKAMK